MGRDFPFPDKSSTMYNYIQENESFSHPVSGRTLSSLTRKVYWKFQKNKAVLASGKWAGFFPFLSKVQRKVQKYQAVIASIY
jgi:hypothetical protein